MSRSLVEKMLPARLLVSLGIYLQSAAHLELTIWQIVMLIDGVDQNSIDQLKNSLEVKKVTPTLVKQLRLCSSKCHAPIGLRVCALASKISEGLENRNLAAHGAFFWGDETDSARVAHYFARGKKQSREWYEFQGAVSNRAIKTAIEEIDSLLREAISIRSDIELRT